MQSVTKTFADGMRLGIGPNPVGKARLISVQRTGYLDSGCDFVLSTKLLAANKCRERF